MGSMAIALWWNVAKCGVRPGENENARCAVAPILRMKHSPSMNRGAAPSLQMKP